MFRYEQSRLAYRGCTALEMTYVNNAHRCASIRVDTSDVGKQRGYHSQVGLCD